MPREYIQVIELEKHEMGPRYGAQLSIGRNAKDKYEILVTKPDEQCFQGESLRGGTVPPAWHIIVTGYFPDYGDEKVPSVDFLSQEDGTIDPEATGFMLTAKSNRLFFIQLGLIRSDIPLFGHEIKNHALAGKEFILMGAKR